MCVIMVHKPVRRHPPSPALGNELSCWGSPRGKEVRAASRQQSTRSWGPRTDSPQGTGCCRQPRARKQIIPAGAQKTAAPTHTLTAASRSASPSTETVRWWTNAVLCHRVWVNTAVRYMMQTHRQNISYKSETNTTRSKTSKILEQTLHRNSTD